MKPTPFDIMAAHRSGDKEKLEGMLAQFPPKIRAGIEANLEFGDQPEKLNKRLIEIGLPPEHIDPLPYLP